jgi:hypothetical protein
MHFSIQFVAAIVWLLVIIAFAFYNSRTANLPATTWWKWLAWLCIWCILALPILTATPYVTSSLR